MAVSDEQLGNLRGEQLAQRYEIGAICGRGALCVVYTASDLLLHRTVAIKVSPLSVADAYREALEATGALSYPAFLAVYDVIEQAGRLYVVQEYIDGRPLSYYIADGAPARRAVALALQLARGIAYAHQHDLAHGDLTASAILIDRLAMAHINNAHLPPDWDYFSAVAATVALSGIASGEDQTLARLVEDERLRDIWAIGAALWLLVTRPIGEPLASSGVAAREFREDVTLEIRSLLVRVLDLAREDRIASANALALALEALDATMTLAASDPTLPVPPSVRAFREARTGGYGQRENPLGFKTNQSAYAGNLYFESVASGETDSMTLDRSQTRPANGSSRRLSPGRVSAQEERRSGRLHGYTDELAEDFGDAPTNRRWMWFTVGIVLFVAFFLLGYLIAPQLRLF